MDIKSLIQTSFAEATSKRVTGDTKQKIHQNRSRIWVETLAEKFREHFKDDSDILVFSKYHALHRKDFGLNELLHDIVVCRVDKVKSATHKKDLYYVREVIWQIESEFARDSRQALIDFNKLVLGSAQEKLFIGPIVKDTKSYLETLRPAALSCQGNVHIALVPHPRDWDTKTDSIKLWKFDR